mgnify:CR=1 FL=1
MPRLQNIWRNFILEFLTDISDEEIKTVYKIISRMEENLKSHAEDKEGSL